MQLTRGAGSSTHAQAWVIGSHALLNQAFEALLMRLPGIEIAGRATSLEEIPPGSLEAEAFLAIWILPTATEIKTLSSLLTQHLSGKVLLFSIDWAPENLSATLKAGAAGCLSANMSLEDFGDALRQAARGETYLPDDLARMLILELAQGEKPPAPQSYDLLTPKEKEILPLLCLGYSNKRIAQNLYVSVRTVENHLANIYEKLGVRSRTEAAVLAIQNDWR